MKSVIFILIALALISASCTSFQPGSVELTVPSKWVLESMGKVGAETPVVKGSTVTLEINEEGKLGGSSGCNSYGATYKLEGTKLTITDVIGTLMACADDVVMQQESQYLTALQSVTNFQISGDKLTIFYDNGESQLNFVKP